MNLKTSKQIVQSIIIFFVVMIFLSMSKLVSLIVDYWWISGLGFSEIFLTELKMKVILFFIAMAISFVIISINLLISTKLNRSELISLKHKMLVAFFVSIFLSAVAPSSWLTTLQFFNQSLFNITEPIFSKDISFYIFTLPFLEQILQFVFSVILFSLGLVALDYFQSVVKKLFVPLEAPKPGEIPSYNFGLKNIFSVIKKKQLMHLSVLGSFVFILLSLKHYLSRYSIMYSSSGIVVGAGYTDVNITLPIITILTVLSIVVTLSFYVWIFIISNQPKLRKRHILIFIISIYLIFGFIGPTVVPGIVQHLWVSPNEINFESPYINNNIEFTKLAYGLSDVTETDFVTENNITQESIDGASETINNVRILDRRPLQQTYKQTQEIRLYYDLSGIDVDRYDIDGKYTEVLIAPREMDQSKIAENAKTWVNLHTVYTHGYGVVMSPVNSVTTEGLPNYLIKDIPPVYSVEESSIKINRPEIYYGEKWNDYVIVNTNTKEFDYPKGNSNEYSSYQGNGGVKLDSFIKKLFFAIKFGDIKILLSSDITTESRLMLNRNILDRVSKVMPFLSYDEDPYIVINDGKLYWMLDAYTISNYYPYSEKYAGFGYYKINYIRNPVKVVIDAYSGEISYYMIDPDEPIVKTLASSFKSSFKSFDEMPEGLKDHIRYPKTLFKVQSEIYRIYHMNDAKVFYNKEDAWDIPTELYGTNQQVKVDPYHIIMKLPEEQREEFILMSTFTPIKKNNMVSWLAARSDTKHYGKLLLYKFSKDKLVYGPLQIEAKFDQDSEISQQLTLWSQQGSSVTRGNLLVIPIDNSLLYIEPLYIQAETGQLPELKRILVSDGEKVIMEKDLETALSKILNLNVKTDSDSFDDDYEIDPDSDITTDSNEELLDKAKLYYDSILDAMSTNNWSSFGDNFDKLGQVLNELDN